MKNLTIALMATAAFASVGCKKKGGGAGEAMAKMGEFKDKMCACKDAKCAQGVQEEMTKWSQEMAKNAGDKKPEPMSEEDTKKYTEATTKMAECAQTAMSAGGGADPGSAAAAGSGSAAPAAGSGSAAPAAGGEVKVGEGPVVPAKALALHEMPPFKGVPDGALWTSVEAEKDGNKFANLFVYGKGDEKEGYVSIRIIDCNSPTLKEYAAKPEESGDFQWCFRTPAADAQKVGEYPRLDKADDAHIAIKVDHLIVRMGVWAGKEDKIKKDDLAAYLATVDFKPLLAAAK
jgi:hypothetical protein